MPLSTRVWSAGKLFVLAAALLATYLLFFAAATRLALRAREVKVPELKGRSVNEATTTVNTLGLSLKVDEARRFDPIVPAGHVTSQEPAAGAAARRGRSVKVWVSSGARVATVPKLIGETERTAEVRVQQEGLGLARLSEIRSSDYPAGTVVAQEPPADSHGNRVALLINRGEQGPSYIMPDLIGVNGERAADVLRARGFRVAVVGEQPYPGVPPGVVLRQYPQGGFQIAPGQPISLEVSR